MFLAHSVPMGRPTVISREGAILHSHASEPLPQRILNGEIHNWYRIVLGYSDHLVAGILDEFGIEPGQTVLDPFCGTGTTLVECMKRGVDAVGIDANPASCYAASVKTNWGLRSERLRDLGLIIKASHKKFLRRKRSIESDPTFVYLENSGMLRRGWISPEPLRQAIALKQSINSLETSVAYRRACTLALVAEFVGGASNVKFGPELYCVAPKKSQEVVQGLIRRIDAMASDLDKVHFVARGRARVLRGDSRNCGSLLLARAPGPYAAVITSPPYPAEHDYTRNSRLELALLEQVNDRESLRQIKKAMLRSHTKGIYKGDEDALLVEGDKNIQRIVTKVRRGTRDNKDGFAKLYPSVVQHYFGGMKRHLQSMRPLLAPGASCAYVVGDQASYVRVHIPTAKLLAYIAIEVGYEVLGVRRWRTRRATSTSQFIDENILLLRWPGGREA